MAVVTILGKMGAEGRGQRLKKPLGVPASELGRLVESGKEAFCFVEDPCLVHLARGPDD